MPKSSNPSRAVSPSDSESSSETASTTTNQEEKEDTENDQEFDCNCTCAKGIFTFFNFIYFLICLSLLGITIWCAVDRVSTFTNGESKISYGFFGFSVFGVLMCLVGLSATISDGVVITGVYLILHGLMITLQCELILVAHIIYRTPEAMSNQAWLEMSDGLRNIVSAQVRCCGLETYTDTYSTENDVPDACRDESNHIFLDGCGSAMLIYFRADGLAALIVTLAGIGLIQMVAFIAAFIFFKHLRSVQADDDEDNDLNSNSQLIPRNNRVTPIITQDSEHVRAKQSERVSSQPSTSRRDVNVGISTPIPDKPQGNEALFSVAGMMLQN